MSSNFERYHEARRATRDLVEHLPPDLRQTLAGRVQLRPDELRRLAHLVEVGRGEAGRSRLRTRAIAERAGVPVQAVRDLAAGRRTTRETALAVGLALGNLRAFERVFEGDADAYLLTDSQGTTWRVERIHAAGTDPI